MFAAESHAQWALVADYGIPFLAEMGFTVLEDIPFTKGLISLQGTNLRNGFSKHLQDKITAKTQDAYNAAFPPVKSEFADEFQTSMTDFYRASLRAHSTESIKSRMTMASWMPIFDALFTLETPDALAFAVYLFSEFLPEYSPDDLEIYDKARSQFQKISLKDVETQLVKYGQLEARVHDVLAIWALGESASNSHRENHVVSMRPLMTSLVGAGLASYVNGKLPASITPLNRAFSDGMTRAQVFDLAARTRKLVQNIGEPAANLTSTSYDLHRRRQMEIGLLWSELGLVMRTNLFRYLAVIVPGLVTMKSAPTMAVQSAMLANMLSYIRQYDPEYLDDRFLRWCFEAVLGGMDYFTPEFKENVEGNLRWIDPGYALPEVQAYYAAVLNPIPLSLIVTDLGYRAYLGQSLSQIKKSTGIPLPSIFLTWSANLLHTNLKGPLTKVHPVLGGVYDQFGKALILGVSEPGSNDIQQAINDFTRATNKSNAETQLSQGYVQLNARFGMDAQMARAIFERFLPTLNHILDAAREAYERGEVEKAASIMLYWAELITVVYPETSVDDHLLATMARSRFTQFVDVKRIAEAIERILPREKEIFSCLVNSRLFYAGLTNANCDNDGTATSMGMMLAFYGVTTFAYALPGLVAWQMPPKIQSAHVSRATGLNPAYVTANLGGLLKALNVAYSAAKNLLVVNTFMGVAKPLVDLAKSNSQSTGQLLFLKKRVDEDETWDKSRKLFSNRQWELPKHLNGLAQEGRKDLIVVLANWAFNFRQVNPEYRTFEEFLKTPLGQHYAEGAGMLRPFFEKMRSMFSSEI